MSLFGKVFSPAGLVATLKRPSAVILIIINLSMIGGVLWWGWTVMELVFLYWVENLIVGVINVLRMIIASGSPTGQAVTGPARDMPAAAGLISHGIKFFLIPFFIIHYGGFCFGHGHFVMSMFGSGPASGGLLETAQSLLDPTLKLAILSLALSHGFSFFSNYIGSGEYRRTNAGALMMRPYGRIVALHITILFGAFFTQVFGNPIGLLIILVVMKTLADLGLHEIERQKLGQNAA